MKDIKKGAGLWIDHRKAVIVFISAAGQELMEIRSNVERQPGRFDGVRSTAPYEAQMVKADDSQQRAYTDHLEPYFEEVAKALRGTESLLIFGPGEAKGDLKKHLDHTQQGEHVIAMGIEDKMTNRQITAKVREHFGGRA